MTFRDDFEYEPDYTGSFPAFTRSRDKIKPSSKAIQSQMVALAAAYDEALKCEAESVARYGHEPEADGSVIRWRMRFRKGGVKYIYAAVKANGLWYTTGPNSPKGYTWDELVSWLDNAHRVYGFEVLS